MEYIDERRAHPQTDRSTQIVRDICICKSVRFLQLSVIHVCRDESGLMHNIATDPGKNAVSLFQRWGGIYFRLLLGK